MLERPDFVPKELAKAEIAHDWDYDISREMIYPMEHEHVRLGTAISQLNIRAAFATVAACAEWVAWRFETHAKLDDIGQRIEAAYASVIDPLYAFIQSPDRDDYPEEPIEIYGPLEFAAELIASGYFEYVRGDVEVKAVTFSMALLARHVVPDVVEFDHWLSDVLRRCAKRYPDDGTPPVNQPPVPRGFFCVGAAPDEVAVRTELSRFASELAPSKNRFLRSAQDMAANGFKGNPYPT